MRKKEKEMRGLAKAAGGRRGVELLVGGCCRSGGGSDGAKEAS